MKTIAVTFRISEKAHRLLERLKLEMGITGKAVAENIIREAAEKRGITADDTE